MNEESVVVNLVVWAWGDLTDLCYVMLFFMIATFLSTLMRALTERKIRDYINIRYFSVRILHLLFVGIANLIGKFFEQYGVDALLRDTVIMFIMFWEFKVLSENAIALGAPIPQPLISFFEKLDRIIRSKY